MSDSLAYDLHALTARLDRAADRILLSEIGVPYRRFLALFMVGHLQAGSQRALAERLGVTEPSVSRMTAALATSGLLTVARDAGGGNKRMLALTSAGQQLVDRCQALLGDRFSALVAQSGVNAARYARDTERLLATLEHAEDGARRS